MITTAGPGVARGALLNLVGQGVPIAVGVISIPFIVHRLGPERFGLLALAWAALGYFTIFDLGLSRSTTRLVAATLGRGEPATVRSIARTAVILQAAVGAGIGLILAAVVPWVVAGVFHVPPPLASEAQTSFYVLAAAVPVIVTAAAYRGILEAHRRFDLVNAVRVLTGAATFALPAAALALGAGLPVMVALLALARITAGGVYAVMCRRILGPDRAAGFDRRAAAALFAFGGWVMVSNVTAPVLIYLDRALISAIISLAAVAYYTAPYEMVARLWIVPSSLALALFPAVSLLGRDAPDRLRFLYGRSIKMVLVGMTPIVLLLVTFAERILTVWLGQTFAEESTRVLQVLAMGVLISSLAHIPSEVLHGLGRPDLPAKFMMIELPLYAVGAWLLTRAMGIAGTALALVLRVLLDAALLFAAAAVLLPAATHQREAPALGPAMLLAGAFAGVLAVAAVLREDLWLQVAVAGCATAGFGWLAWSRVFDPRDREALRSALQMGLPGRGGRQ